MAKNLKWDAENANWQGLVLNLDDQEFLRIPGIEDDDKNNDYRTHKDDYLNLVQVRIIDLGVSTNGQDADSGDNGENDVVAASFYISGDRDDDDIILVGGTNDANRVYNRYATLNQTYFVENNGMKVVRESDETVNEGVNTERYILKLAEANNNSGFKKTIGKFIESPISFFDRSPRES